MKQKIIVLGSKGFLGSYLLSSFSKEGKYEVTGLTRDDIDLTSHASVSKLVSYLDNNPVVIMAASVINKDKSFSAFEQEIEMFMHIASPEIISKVKHFILVSGAAIYGYRRDSPIDESSGPNPDELYSLSKYIGELIFKQASREHGISLSIVRPGILYGKGDSRTPLFKFIKAAKSGRNIEMHGDDSTKLIWLHIKDMHKAIKQIIDEHKTGDYNVIGEITSLQELAEKIIKSLGKDVKINFVSSNKKSPSVDFNLSKFKRDFPGFKFTQLEEGIIDYL